MVSQATRFKLSSPLSPIRRSPLTFTWLSMVCVLLFSGRMSSCQEVSLRLRSDDVVFEGVSISMLCSVSDSGRNDTIEMVIRDGEGTLIPSGQTSLGMDEVYTEISSTIGINTSSQKFTCDVEWQEKGFIGNATLIVEPERPTAPFCYSNYSGGVLVGETVRLVCYRAGEIGSLTWTTESQVALMEKDGSGLVWGSVGKNEITIEPTVDQNGSNFQCGFRSQMDGMTRNCSVGPIHIFQTVSLYIEQSPSDSVITLLRGQDQNFSCTSIPAREATWSQQGPARAGVDVSISGSDLSVSITTADDTFSGAITFLCSLVEEGDIPVSPLTLTIEVSPSESTVRPSPTTELPEGPPGNIILIIILAGVAGLLIIIVAVLLCLYIFYRCRRSAKSIVEPEIADDPDKLASREYAVPPFGYQDKNEVNVANSAGGSEDNEHESYAMVTKSEPAISLSEPAVPVPHTALDSPGYGQVNGHVNEEFSSAEQRTGVPSDMARVSVVYAHPVNKDGDFDGDKQNDPPSYATVNKSRHIPIDDSGLDDDNELDDFDDDAYWDAGKL